MNFLWDNKTFEKMVICEEEWNTELLIKRLKNKVGALQDEREDSACCVRVEKFEVISVGFLAFNEEQIREIFKTGFLFDPEQKLEEIPLNPPTNWQIDPKTGERLKKRRVNATNPLGRVTVVRHHKLALEDAKKQEKEEIPYFDSDSDQMRYEKEQIERRETLRQNKTFQRRFDHNIGTCCGEECVAESHVAFLVFRGQRYVDWDTDFYVKEAKVALKRRIKKQGKCWFRKQESKTTRFRIAFDGRQIEAENLAVMIKTKFPRQNRTRIDRIESCSGKDGRICYNPDHLKVMLQVPEVLTEEEKSEALDAFLQFVEYRRCEGSGHWCWTGALHPRIPNCGWFRKRKAHSFYWELTKNDVVPDGVYFRTECGHPICLSHLMVTFDYFPHPLSTHPKNCTICNREIKQIE